MMVPLTLAARRDALGPHLHLAGAFRHLLQFLFVLPCQLLDSFVIVVAPVREKLLDASRFAEIAQDRPLVRSRFRRPREL